MNYEEKFKNLVAAIKKLQEANPSDEGIQNWVNDNVPELAEPEDETTWLKKYVEEEISCLSIDVRDDDDRIKLENLKRSLAWLEKQGEHKPVDKVESKFKVGNWYQCTKDFFGKGVTFDKNTAYYCAEEGCLQDEYGCHIAIVKDLYDNFKLWAIQDAKDGDVLACDNNAFLFSKYEKDEYGYVCCSYGGILGNEEFLVNMHTKKYWVPVEFTCPATKEQRDLLFQKMREAGYAWNAEELKLEKVEQNPSEKVDVLMSLDEAIEHCKEKSCGNNACALEHKQLEKWLTELKELKEQKPDWSEEDKLRAKQAIMYLSKKLTFESEKDDYNFREGQIKWLKSLTHIPIEDIC